MKRVVKDYSKFSVTIQEDIYAMYSNNELERASFLYKNAMVDGVIYAMSEQLNLIPLSSIYTASIDRLENNDQIDELPSIAEDEE
ncbi:MAG: hypothetical protein H8E74_06830 [Gammaproteobacteria bacterium]|nr:hypothetical protein [Gammaproteobacteria bacterium]